MTVSRLRDIPGIGVDKVGDAADAAADPRFLRLENLDTDLRPPQVALEATHAAIDRDDANSYLPFQGHLALREAACAHVAAITGRGYDPATQCVSVAGGLNGILNVLLATVEPGQEVVICDPVYAGLVNRIRLAGGVPRFVSCTPGPGGWATDPGELAAAIGPRTAAVLLMSPVMPTGAVLGGEHFDAIAGPVTRHRAWVIWDAAMERIRFDGQPPVHPGAHPGLADRTITVGSASKELRMVGSDYPPSRLESVELGHPDVHQDYGRVTSRGLGHRLKSVSRFCYHFDVLFAGEQHPEAGADHRLIVGDEDTNRHDRYPFSGRHAARVKPPPLVVAVVISPL